MGVGEGGKEGVRERETGMEGGRGREGGMEGGREGEGVGGVCVFGAER